MSRCRFMGLSLQAAALAALLNLGSGVTTAAAEAPSPPRFVASTIRGEFIDHFDVVLPYRTDVYRLTFVGGEAAMIDVEGDGSTDLDCRVYDANGNLVDSDLDGTDYCVLRWVPRRTGTFRLEVRNLGGIS